MDKQIIIDGVNVKDCKRRIGKDNFCRYYKRPCAENNYNCIWKKYLRKEQECERLNNIINEAKNSKLDLKSFLVGEAVQNEYEQQLDQLKVENKELKKISCKFKDYCTCDTEKLKQTLTEIKEIAERGFKHSQCNCGAKADLDLILQKISECDIE